MKLDLLLKKFSLILVLCLLFCCGRIERGVVIHKEYKPAYTEETIRYDVALKMPLPETIHHSERYVVWVRGVTKDNDTITNDYDFDKEDYNKYNIEDSIYFNY